MIPFEEMPPGKDLVGIGAVARELGLSVARVRTLADRGELPFVLSEGGHRRFSLDAVRAAASGSVPPPRPDAASPTMRAPTMTTVFEVNLPLAGLAEDQVWLDAEPHLDLAQHPEARSVVWYAFTEMLNNAIDHSRGTSVHVRFWRSVDLVAFEVADDGVGVFHRLAQGLGLAEDIEAVAELTKGGRTTAPDAHTGQGIFFTSKAVDVFRLQANGLQWIVDNRQEDPHALGSSRVSVGTVVSVDVNLSTARSLAEITKQFSEDTVFTRSRPVVKLFGLGVEFVSRSEAKRLLAGMEKFTEIDVDFTGVTTVGQGFVDEVLRVWPNAHPGTTVTPIGMTGPVAFMVERGLAERDGSA